MIEAWAITCASANCTGLRKLLADVCAPLCDMDISWLPTLSRSVASIGEIVIQAVGDVLDVSALRNVEVNHATMFGEDWSTPYEICWQADGAGNCITMPDMPSFDDRHFAYFAEGLGHKHPGQTLLYQYL